MHQTFRNSAEKVLFNAQVKFLMKEENCTQELAEERAWSKIASTRKLAGRLNFKF